MCSTWFPYKPVSESGVHADLTSLLMVTHPQQLCHFSTGCTKPKPPQLEVGLLDFCINCFLIFTQQNAILTDTPTLISCPERGCSGSNNQWVQTHTITYLYICSLGPEQVLRTTSKHQTAMFLNKTQVRSPKHWIQQYKRKITNQHTTIKRDSQLPMTKKPVRPEIN